MGEVADEERQAFLRRRGWSDDLPEECHRSIEEDWSDEEVELCVALGW